jgi:PEP-CTERM motif
MKRSLPPLWAAALLLAAPAARADHAPWSYEWTPTAFEMASTTGAGAVNFTAGSGTADGNSTVVAMNLEAFSTADPSTPDTFVDASYAISIALTDTMSGESGSLSFAGLFNGSLSTGAVNIDNEFTGEPEQSLVLGGRTYTVTIGPYTAPGVPGTPNLGAISASVAVTGDGPAPPPPNTTPEPSSLVLAALGVSSLGLRWLRGRRNALVLA